MIPLLLFSLATAADPDFEGVEKKLAAQEQATKEQLQNLRGIVAELEETFPEQVEEAKMAEVASACREALKSGPIMQPPGGLVPCVRQAELAGIKAWAHPYALLSYLHTAYPVLIGIQSEALWRFALEESVDIYLIQGAGIGPLCFDTGLQCFDSTKMLAD